MSTCIHFEYATAESWKIAAVNSVKINLESTGTIGFHFWPH